MNYIDLILGLILLFAGIRGFRKGFVSELAALAALILGIWGAIKFSHLTSDFLVENFNLKTGNLYIISFIVTFILIVILVQIFANSVNKFIEVAMLGMLNKLAGLVFGILKTALVLSVLLLAIDFIENEKQIIPEDTKAKSHLYEPVKKLAPSLLPFIDGWWKTPEKEESPKII